MSTELQIPEARRAPFSTNAYTPPGPESRTAQAPQGGAGTEEGSQRGWADSARLVRVGLHRGCDFPLSPSDVGVEPPRQRQQCGLSPGSPGCEWSSSAGRLAASPQWPPFPCRPRRIATHRASARQRRGGGCRLTSGSLQCLSSCSDASRGALRPRLAERQKIRPP